MTSVKILGIETSCDETGAAVIEGFSKDQPVKLLSNRLATSMSSHAVTGGIIPEVAAREQVHYILPVIKEALDKSGVSIEKPNIDAIAVTYGPGLIGSLLVGVETAKTLSMLWKVPIIPVNHLYGHIYANFIQENSIPIKSGSKSETPKFPALALVVSGGHTDLVLLKKHGDLEVIGGTRDDAAGECFDKSARLLGYEYPGGPTISKLAEKGDPKRFTLPWPMLDSHDFDFSFSGLKTAFLILTKKHFPVLRSSLPNSRSGWNQILLDNNIPVDEKQVIYDLCAVLERAIISTLAIKTFRAVLQFDIQSLLLSGGVAANKNLVQLFKQKIDTLQKKIIFFVPPPYLCTDNAAMVAAAGFYNRNRLSWQEVSANPELYY